MISDFLEVFMVSKIARKANIRQEAPTLRASSHGPLAKASASMTAGHHF